MSESEKGISTFQRVQVLLHEYDTLRNEMIGRTRDGFALLSVTTTLFIGVISILYSAAGLWPAAVLAILGGGVFTVAVRETIKGINAISSWVSQLEARVNDLAGERLLSWESENSAAKMGWFGRALKVRSDRRR